ncbi:MAG TPA: DinB family protein [Terriglobales bacterium]|nr:DinB family protein [Terriglobales bacterium]
MASPQGQLNLSPQLADLRRQFEACSEQARKMLTEFDEASLKQRPPSGGWCAVECVVHLSLTTANYESIFQDGFGRAVKGSEPYRRDLKGRLLAWIMEPPYKHGVKTRENFEPVNVASARQVLTEFLESQKMMFARLERANGLALDKVKVASPFKQSVTYNLFSLFWILAAHQRRHLWQAQQALKNLKK